MILHTSLYSIWKNAMLFGLKTPTLTVWKHLLIHKVRTSPFNACTNPEKGRFEHTFTFKTQLTLVCGSERAFLSVQTPPNSVPEEHKTDVCFFQMLLITAHLVELRIRRNHNNLHQLAASSESRARIVSGIYLHNLYFGAWILTALPQQAVQAASKGVTGDRHTLPRLMPCAQAGNQYTKDLLP